MTKLYKALFCLESSQVDQYTFDDLVSREEHHIHIVEMVFRKAVNTLSNLASRNSTVSTSSKYKQVSTKSVSHPSSSESDNNVQFRNQANKQKQPDREERQRRKHNQPESEEELQTGDALNLMFKYFGNQFNNMQSKLAERLRSPSHLSKG